MPIEYTPWYLNQIEEPIREVVYILRNHGIDTISSCGHEMYVTGRTTNPTVDLQTIHEVLTYYKYKFELQLTINSTTNFEGYCPYYFEIKYICKVLV